MEGPPGPGIIEDNIFTELSVGREEMLYALNSTLEALEDGSILEEEYYVRFDTPGFQHESGCQSGPNSHDFELLKVKVSSMFEAVEHGHLTEDDYYFALITPYFYYKSGNYNKLVNLKSTLQALVDTYNDESGNEHLQEHIESTFEDWIESYSSEVIIVLHSEELGNEIPEVEDYSLGSMHKPFDYWGSATDAQSDKACFKILLGIITCLLKNARLSDPKKNLVIWMVCSFCLRASVAGKRIQPGITKQLCSCTVTVFLFFGFFAAAIPSAKAAHQETPLTLRAGSNGIIPFNCSVSDPLDMSNVFYTVRFEAKDRPFCVDGVFDQEGFISPDQSERFSTKLNIKVDTLAVNINIAFVSTEDEGTYELETLYYFGSKDVKSQVMTKIVKVHVPPGPAMCYFKHNADYAEKRLLRCHCRPGNGNSTLSCFRNGVKIPFIGRRGVVTSRTFWVFEDTSPVVCCSHEYGEPEDVTADSCGQQFRFPRHQIKTTLPPRTQNKEGAVVVEDLPKLTNVIFPKATEEPVVMGSGCAMHSNLLFSTFLPLLTFLVYV